MRGSCRDSEKRPGTVSNQASGSSHRLGISEVACKEPLLEWGRWSWGRGAAAPTAPRCVCHSRALGFLFYTNYMKLK